ncbi:hypothetical protein [Gloeobacter kilaueensis]|uniref:Glycosyltransferase RgtA/B/C/D-like domain-containing protein n=1 Tax=Gloeobacter kilaueensis (strain ATCC BAA-2537 / CCAP 1431/1 / ULC 316 / JS1) TaxID=1183438 RepID=U5QJ56_GLOK1|nr:hypothetical protein [Gloeobacter kilaueensis]AGY57659.1 hypothetical protein GKIL_1413 [Gloeobacter kilaueensis JS1]
MSWIRSLIDKFFAPLFENENRFALTLTALFFVLGAAGLVNHAMWRDEINVWLIVRDSPSLPALLSNIKYEGHPALWYLCLYPLSRLSHNPALMQVFHLLLATLSVYLFVRHSPFTRPQKLLYLFGYLPFYEYLLISRNYAFGILLVFAFCTVHRTQPRKYLILSLLLALLANTNAYGLLIAGCLQAMLLLECATKGRPWGQVLAGSGVFGLGAVAALALIIPNKDNTLAGGATGWTLYFDLNHFFTALTRIWSGYIVVLVPNDAHAWEMVLFSIPAIGLLAFGGALLLRKPVACFFYLSATASLFVLTYVKFIGAQRHFGHFFIVLLAALWLAEHYAESDRLPGRLQRWADFAERYRGRFLTTILVFQLAGGIVAYCRDWLVPYSASREAADFIHGHGLDRFFIVGSRDYAISPLCGYLDRQIYYPENRRLSSFVLFNGARKEVDAKETLDQVYQLLEKGTPEPILLILNHPVEPAVAAGLNVRVMAQFTDSFISEEVYYLYLVTVRHSR